MQLEKKLRKKSQSCHLKQTVQDFNLNSIIEPEGHSRSREKAMGCNS
jgi:hypothetical protein